MKRVLSFILAFAFCFAPAIFAAPPASASGEAVIDHIDIRLSQTPQAGAKKPDVIVDENNFIVGDGVKWDGSFSNGAFVAGETYVLTVSLTAYKGWRFADGDTLSAPVLGRAPDDIRYSEPDGFYAVSLDYSFQISPKSEISDLRVGVSTRAIPLAGNPAKYMDHSDFTLYGTSAVSMPAARIKGFWREGGKTLSGGDRYVYGKTYCFDLVFTLEYPDRYIFSKNVRLNLTNYGGYESEVLMWDASSVTVRLKITARFPGGAGESASNPAECYSFEDLKYALENPDMPYVRLYDVADPGSGAYNVPYFGGIETRYYPIQELGTHYLTVAGDATFRFKDRSTAKTAIPESFICVTGTLYVNGEGSVKYIAPEYDAINAVFLNRGRLTFNGGVTVMSEMYGVSYKTPVPRAVCQTTSGAVLTVNGGSFKTVKTVNTSSGHGVVEIRGGKAYLNSGKYGYDLVKNSPDKNIYALFVNSASSVTLRGGEYKRISLPDGRTVGDAVPPNAVCRLDGAALSRSASAAELKNGNVSVTTEISSLNVITNAPSAGAVPGDFASVTDGATAVAYSWYDNTLKKYMKPDDTFESGHVYTVNVRVTADGDHTFRTNSSGGALYTVELNGKTVSPKSVAGFALSACFDVSMTFSACPNTVDRIDLTVTPPVAGKLVSTGGVTPGHPTYALYKTDPVTWYDATAKKYLAGTDRFVEGHSYRLSVWVAAMSGYEFPVDKNLDPNVSAAVNGDAATVVRAYEQSAFEVVEVQYDFGVCSTTVSVVNLSELIRPVPGAAPDFNILSNDMSRYTVRDVQWISDKAMTESDTFAFSKRYTLMFTVQTERVNGVSVYEFSPSMSLYIDGELIPSSKYVRYSDKVNVEIEYITPDEVTYSSGSGDVNGDGDVTVKDVLLMRRYIAGLGDLTAEAIFRGDVNGDGDITTKDVLTVRRIIAGLE